MAKIFVTPDRVSEKSIIIDDRDDIRHIVKVLRLREGDTIEVSDGAEWEYVCEIASVNGDGVEAIITDKQGFAREPRLKVTLFQGIPKAGKMETIIQKCTELGIYSVVPVWNERTVVADKGNFAKKTERWQRIADEAAKQCRRGIIPTIEEEIKFKELEKRLKSYDLIIFPYENESEYTIKDLLSAIDDKPLSAALIIGPEGGFSKEEAEMIVAAGGRAVTLGKTILRTETAGPAALAMTMYALEL